MQYFVNAKTYEAQKNYLGAIVALRSAADLDPSSATVFRLLARNYERIGDYDMSIHFARKALSLEPDNTDLRYDLVRWLETRGEREGAAHELEVLLEYDSDVWPLYSQLANIYLETGAEKKISDLFSGLLKHPELPADVKTNAAYVLARSGNHAQAKSVFQEVLADDPTAEDAWLGLAELALSRGERDMGMSYLRRAARQLPDSQLVMYELARLLVTSMDVEMLLQEEDAAFLYRLGVSLSELKKFSLAATVFERIVGLKPTTVEGWLEPIRYYIHVDEFARAEELLQSATKAMPDSVDLYLFWAGALEKAERYDEAMARYEEGVRRVPHKAVLYLLWGFALEERQRWADAIEIYKRGLEATDSDAELYTRWGISLGRQQRWQEAVSRYRKAAEVAAADSTLSDALLHWGIALEKLERWERAVDRLTEAARLNKDDSLSLFYLGGCLERASRALEDTIFLSRSIETFKHLIDISPNDSYALNYLGYMYAERGIHLNEAVALLTKAVALDPVNGAFFDSLGWAYFRLGEFERAEQYLDKALDQLDGHESEEQATIYDHAGDIAQALGKSDAAIQHWRRALDLVPDNEEVRRKLGQTLP